MEAARVELADFGVKRRMRAQMTVIERVEEAVAAAEDIKFLRGYLQGHLDAGLNPDLLAEALRRSYEHLREEGNEDAADLVLDGLDLLTAWCGPELGLRIPA